MPGLWLEQALEGERAAAPLDRDRTADVCVVGGGLTGLWTALHAKEAEPGAEVVLIEQRYCGYGASGRNQGQVLDWWVKLPAFEAALGAADALRLARAAEASVEQLGAFCAEHAIDAGYRRSGWLWGATNPAQLGAWDAVLAAHARHGVTCLRPLGREEAQALGGSPRLLGGVLQENAAVVQPAALVRGLRRVALERGVTIHEGTPMTELVREPGPCVVTPGGRVRAGRVVLALNCWLTRFPEIARKIVVVGSDIAATGPVPERLAEAGFDAGVPLTDSRMLLKYARATPDGRVALGLAGTALASRRGDAGLFAGLPSAARLARLEASFAFLFPALADVPFTHVWTGPVDRSWSGLPGFGSLGDDGRVPYVAGYSGNGVGPAHLAGRALASLALGREDEWSELAALLPARGGVPPEPLRTLGGRLVRAAVARRERCEDAGRRVDPATARLAALAPSGVVPKRRT